MTGGPHADAEGDRDVVERLIRAAAPQGGTGSLEQLRERLASHADAAGLVDVAVRTLDSPLGQLMVAVTPRGVVRVAFELEDHDRVLDELAGDVGARVLRSGALTDPVARGMGEYFEGRRRDVGVSVDLRLPSGFRRDVVSGLARIEYGATASYAQVAELVGRPGAARAVGTACALNPVPVVLPCHRVVRSDGTSGRYRGGPAAKAWLLDLERSVVDRPDGVPPAPPVA